MRKSLTTFVVLAVIATFTGLSGVLARHAVADPGHVFSIADVTAAEGNGGTSDVTMTVSVSPAPQAGETISVDWATSDAAPATATKGTAPLAYPEDFETKSGTATFSALQSSRSITMTLAGDTIDEANSETFAVNLFNAQKISCTTPCTSSSVSIGDPQGIFTITDDDTPHFSVGNLTANEGTGANPTLFNFVVTRTGDSDQDVSVDYSTSNVTATAPSDFTAVSATKLTFAPGEFSKNAPVNVVADSTDEPNETFHVNLSNAVDTGRTATIIDNLGVGTINDDDPPAPDTINIDDASGPEGGNVTFTVTLSTAPGLGEGVSVGWQTEASPGTADEDVDFDHQSGTVSFGPGETSRTFNVATTQDPDDEPNETFTVSLVNPSDTSSRTYVIGVGTATGTINDDDGGGGGGGGGEPGAGGVSDFNGDGFADAAIGIPGKDVGSAANAGAVHVMYGTEDELSTDGDEVWTLDTAGVTGTAATNDKFGAATVTGDFNGDGFEDLAVGAPGKTSGAGAVAVIYGSDSGLIPDDSQLWTQDSAGVPDTSEANDGFGASLAAGDLDGDDVMDLVIGVPGETLDGRSAAGAIEVLYGSMDGGLSSDGSQIFSQDSAGISAVPETGDAVGRAVAVGDFDGDFIGDIAVGVPGEDIGSTTDAGFVEVLLGSDGGVTTEDNTSFQQGAGGVSGPAESGDTFGAALATADFNGDDISDLAIGTPGEDFSGKKNAGLVNVLYGSGSGLIGDDDQIWTQDSTDIAGGAEDGDLFGFPLATGYFNGDEFADLVVGVRGEDVKKIVDAGAINVIMGSDEGLTADGNSQWFQDSFGINGVSDKGDVFGSALTGADFDGDGFDDLLIGVPGEDYGGKSNAGMVNVIYGTDDGPNEAGNQQWYQDFEDVSGTGVSGDAYGGSVA